MKRVWDKEDFNGHSAAARCSETQVEKYENFCYTISVKKIKQKEDKLYDGK